jgi:tRNA-2-methylthio-N6-dimethylallyladenosine synthase
MDVLVESLNDHDDAMVTGRLTNNVLVHFQGGEELIGTIVPVVLKEAKGFYYIGEMAQEA